MKFVGGGKVVSSDGLFQGVAAGGEVLFEGSRSGVDVCSLM